MVTKPKKTVSDFVEVKEILFSTMQFYLLGTSPLIMNRFSQKAWQELLLPSVKKNRASLEQTLKHDPLSEFQGSTYKTQPTSAAMFHFPTGAFHKAIAQAAIDIPGVKRAQMERLTKVTNVNVDLFGVPQLFMAMVRNSDISRTPDVRTRAIFPQWACQIDVRFPSNMSITQRSVANLVAAAGEFVGIGDWRSEKGGSFGAYTCADKNDAQYLAIVRHQGRAAQQAAYNDPAPYDDDTSDIYAWFIAEVRRREKEGQLHAAEPELPDVPVHVEHGNGEYAGVEVE